MLNRQKIAISMLRELGGSASRLQLTKLMFLVREESQSRGGSAFFGFLPFRYGPYSFALSHEMNSLLRDGYIEERGGGWVLSELGQVVTLPLAKAVSWDVTAIASRYGALPVNDLLDRVYGKYPWYTALAEDASRRAVCLPSADLNVYTMGYEGLSVDDFLEYLLRAGIRRIIDVRRNPISRKFGFHSKTLARLSGLISIGYEHLPDLGVSSQSRRELNSIDDYNELFSWYGTYLLDSQSHTVRRVAELAAESPSALVCQEADAAYCHRSVLADQASTLAGLDVVHLRRE